MSDHPKNTPKVCALPYGRARLGWLGVLPRPPHNSTCVQPPVRGLSVVPTVSVADLDLPPHRESRHSVPTERGRSEGTTESPDTANLEKTSQFSRWMGIKTTV